MSNDSGSLTTPSSTDVRYLQSCHLGSQAYLNTGVLTILPSGIKGILEYWRTDIRAVGKLRPGCPENGGHGYRACLRYRQRLRTSALSALSVTSAMFEQVCTALLVTLAMFENAAMSAMPSNQTLQTLQYADTASSHYQLSVQPNQKFRTPQVTTVRTGQTSAMHVPLQSDSTHTERPETEKKN